MKHLTSRYPWIALATFALVFSAGCDSGFLPRASVRGAITFDGQPVDNGAIAFLPAGDIKGEHVRSGGQIVDGKYAIDATRGPNPGTYRVEVFWNKKTGRKVPSGDPPNIKDETKQILPWKYNVRSVLTVEVQPGRNTLDFDLKK
jgi:hypothetical protein